MSSNLIAGTAQITVDGATEQLEGGLKYSVATVKRTALMGKDGFHGWKEEPVAPFIEMSIRDAGNLTVASFNAMRNATVVASLANGKIVTGRNMGAVDVQEVDTDDAKFTVRFEGPEVSEQTVTVN
jgi:hypothetical protein